MIKGITPRLSEGGKIKIGRKGEYITSRKGTKFQPPQKLDHFLITKTERGGEMDNFMLDTDVMDALPKCHDGKVRELPIVLHSNDVDEVFPTAFARYAGRVCACRGDGENATQWEVKDSRRTGRTKSLACAGLECEHFKRKLCKATGVLHCSIAIEGLAVAGSVYKWRTTSVISIQEMIGSLRHIEESIGVFRGLPLTLILKPVHVRPPDAPASTVYTCYVELRAKNLHAVQQQALQMAQMRQALGCDDARNHQAYLALLSDPSEDNETEAEQADIADEFYPPEVVESLTELQEGTHKVSAPKRQPPEESDDKDDWRAAIAKVQAAQTIDDVHLLTQDEKRKRVLAAAEARISELSKPPDEACQCHEKPNPPVRLDGATRCHRCGLVYEAVPERSDEPPPPTDEDETPFGFTDDGAGF